MGIDDDWPEFARAFAEAGRPDDTQGRSTKRLLIIGFAGMLAVALGAFGYGALTAKGSTGAPGSQVAGITTGPGTVYGATPGGAVSGGFTASSPAAQAPTWTAVAGPTCSNSAARFATSGYYTAASNGQATGWITSSSGGYTGDGCAGGFVSLPLSGQPGVYDTTRYALWTFHLGAGFTGATCVLATFIPSSPQIAYVGGNPASYLVSGTDSSSASTGHRLGAYQLDQLSDRGRWVTSVGLTPKTSWVTVQLVDAGANEPGATWNAHAAAAQIRLTCQAAP